MSTAVTQRTEVEVPTNELLDAFLSGSPQTIEAYRIDLEDFRTYLGVESLQAASNALLSAGAGPANSIVLRYRNALKEKGLQHSTINRRLAAIRSLVKLARVFGLIPWSLEVPNLKREVYRDTRGPGLNKFTELLKLVEDGDTTKSKRDTAILRLLFDLALRASELTLLDITDYDAENGTIAIQAKGKAQKVCLSLPSASREALSEWIAVRGSVAGPLFVNFDRAGKGERLTRQGLYALIRRLGVEVGIKTRPHGVRHLSITEAVKTAQANGYGIEEVLDHSRHQSVSTLMIYRDRERNVQGEIAKLISSKLERTKSK